MNHKFTAEIAWASGRRKLTTVMLMVMRALELRTPSKTMSVNEMCDRLLDKYL